MPDDVSTVINELELVDHHLHGVFRQVTGRPAFEAVLNESSPDPVPGWMTQFDSQVGFAIRRWCAPLLDLEPHADADQYWCRRAEFGDAEITRRFLSAAGVSDWLVDTGIGQSLISDPDAIAQASGSNGYEIIRLERLAEQLVATVPAADYPDAFAHLLHERCSDVIGVKTILAYRAGFDIDLSRPHDSQVVNAVRRWHDQIDHQDGVAASPVLTNPVVISYGIHTALDAGLPLQIHTGYGDRDLDLHRANPLLLTDFLRDPAVQRVPVMLLHCYPYHREAGYLAQAFHNVYFDVGLAINHVGARATDVVAESLELAPFAKQLYSSDAFGLPEFHYLGAVLWRRAIGAVFTQFVADDEWTAADAVRVATMIARENARRVYRLP